jgi:hypothetical protein
MIRKMLFVLVLLGTVAYATPVSDYAYQELASNEIFASETKTEEGFSFDVNFASLLGIVDERFEKDYLVNAPKRVNPLTPCVTLSYKF